MTSLSFITDFAWHACQVLKSKLVQLNPREQKIALAVAVIFAALPGIYAVVYSLRVKSARVNHQHNGQGLANAMTREKILELADAHFNEHRLKQPIVEQLDGLLPRNGGRIDAVQFDHDPIGVGLANKVVVKSEIKMFLMGLNIAVSEAE
ncbi:hypothetical protein PNK_1511 [Candidatus Protochlamydia naegleriophila]|uniref:Uncharacterized protein n=1 Tax=Candidatus Protochlamydia naegleriophila TaxID=389348 RepID=A0A0U5ESI1_9BACT|nr:hypothetical protein [Candidatus Protochlamydia naegleriophila]CUI17121.1 hypothetical protein PNK_1511 [Candidatus Protochlamydia naegleriophila]